MITKSAKRANRKNLRQRIINDKKRETLKKELKAYKKMAISANRKEAKNQLSKIYKILDKNAKIGIIKKNKASRLKSRLTKLLNKTSK